MIHTPETALRAAQELVFEDDGEGTLHPAFGITSRLPANCLAKNIAAAILKAQADALEGGELVALRIRDRKLKALSEARTTTVELCRQSDAETADEIATAIRALIPKGAS